MNKQGAVSQQLVGDMDALTVRVEDLVGAAAPGTDPRAIKRLNSMAVVASPLITKGSEYIDECRDSIHFERFPTSSSPVEYKMGWVRWRDLSVAVTALGTRSDDELWEGARNYDV